MHFDQCEVNWRRCFCWWQELTDSNSGMRGLRHWREPYACGGYPARQARNRRAVAGSVGFLRIWIPPVENLGRQDQRVAGHACLRFVLVKFEAGKFATVFLDQMALGRDQHFTNFAKPSGQLAVGATHTIHIDY